MKIHNNIKHNSSVTDGPWTQLLTLYGQVSALLQDMKNNPQNALSDLDKMINLAQEMVTISDKLPVPPSAHNFHEDFHGLLTFLEQLKSSYTSGITHPDVQVYEEGIDLEMANIKFDILQG